MLFNEGSAGAGVLLATDITVGSILVSASYRLARLMEESDLILNFDCYFISSSSQDILTIERTTNAI